MSLKIGLGLIIIAKFVNSYQFSFVYRIIYSVLYILLLIIPEFESPEHVVRWCISTFAREALATLLTTAAPTRYYE